MTQRTLADMKTGERATIMAVPQDELGVKLMEMGCLPGSDVRLRQVAPMGCPICLEVGHCLLTIRRESAVQVTIG